ncbi:MAG TPA: hypothetical protein VF271_00385 [Rhodanobacteraceae bacterium]
MWLPALLASTAAATVFYLTMARQNCCRKTWPRVWRWFALALAIGGLILWVDSAGTGAGISAALAATMLAWTLLPYLGWWWRARREVKP